MIPRPRRAFPTAVLLAAVIACRSEPKVWYPAVDVAADAVVDTACPAVEAPPAWQRTAMPGGITFALPRSARLFGRYDTVRRVQTWIIDGRGQGRTQILLIEKPLESLRNATDTVAIPAGTPRALLCRLHVRSGVAQIVSTGERPRYTDQHPLMFSAWLPGPKGIMINVLGFGNDPVFRDTLLAVVRSVRVGAVAPAE